MKKVFFSECELKELESTKILGGKNNKVSLQNQCSNSVDGCGAGTTQNQCSNSAECMCVIIAVEDNCPL